MTARYNHVFFDLDHTIWDFETNSWETLEEVWQKFDLFKIAKIPLEDFRNRYREENHKLWVRYNKGEIGKKEIRNTRFKTVLEIFDANRFLDHYLLEEYYLDTCPLKTSLVEGSIEVLDYLIDKGYELHVLSNGFEETTERKLNNSGIKGYFKNTLTSEQLGVTKPQESFFTQAMDISGSTRDEVIMVGDNLSTDIMGAKNAGIDQIYFNPYKAEHQEEPTYEIHQLMEIRNIL